jgi:adenosylhomocysteine nucleosidase
MKLRRYALPFLFAVTLALLAAVPGPAGKDPTPRIGLAGAFGAELDALRDGMSLTRTVTVGGADYTVGRVGEHEVVLIHAGPGMINAAARLQHAADHFTLTHLIFSGVAGALDPDLPLGAVVVPARWVNHQFGAVKADGFAPMPLDVRPFGGTPVPVTGFPVDAALLDAAHSVSGLVTDGTGVSGDLFVADDAARMFLADQFGAQIVDMESAAAAQVATLNGIPFIAVRAVSDHAGDEALAQITNSVDEGARAAARAVIEVVRRISTGE